MEMDNNMGAARGKRSKAPTSFYEDEEMAAHSLVLLSHNSSSAEARLPRPSKRVMKAAQEFHSADSPYEGEKRAWYKCKTCGKSFLSFQALGGHRASCCHTPNLADSEQVKEKGIINKMKVHECTICCRVFSSGQALGGHKRTHSTTPPPTRSAASKNEDKQRAELDLNMPAPLEMEDVIADYDKYNPSLHFWMGSYAQMLRSDYNEAVAVEAERGVGGDIDFKRDILLVATVT